MYELKIAVAKVLGVCTADPAMKPGDAIFVRDGNLRIPRGGYICMWALQSILPLITPKERKIAEDRDGDWMWRVHRAQCPDPAGRVIFQIDQIGEIDPNVGQDRTSSGDADGTEVSEDQTGRLSDLRVVVEEVKGKCTSGMSPGDFFLLRSGRLYIPADRHFCLYALHAVLPLLPAKQRPLEDGDWLKEDSSVICPDPAGNVIMRIEQA
ncbi:TIGR04076 family protein [Chloroflexota bacterium]